MEDLICTGQAKRHTWIPCLDRVRLLYKIDLEADIESIILGIPLDGNHRDEVHERLSTLAVVDDTGLDLTTVMNRGSQTMDSLSVDKSTLRTRDNLAIGALQEPAITADNLVFGITSQPFECVRDVHNRVIVPRDITQDKGTRQVHCTNIDLGIRSHRDSALDNR